MERYITVPKGFKRIPRAADHYVVSGAGFVFNLKTGNLLKQHWNGYNTYTIIRDKEGRQFRFCFEKMHLREYKPLTKEWVLNEDKAKVIPDYPDYAVSNYGAVYIINPRRTGPRAGEVHMICEYGKQGHSYVKLVDSKTKKPREVRVDKLTKLLWGDDCTYDGY